MPRKLTCQSLHPKGWGFLETIHMNFVRVLQSNLREKTNGELCKIF